MKTKQNQIPYRPKKEKVVPLREEDILYKITGADVLDYFGYKIWEHRAFILATLLLLTWTYMVVT